ncbi:MAG: CoA transferase [Myxococcales bacterium]|nr:CoA transferase [Myxococcales bacterium]
MTPPLQGLRVLDLTRLLPGPLTTLFLADLGANVVKIEDPAAPDPLRMTPPLHQGMGAAFRLLNRNKRSLALDLKHPRGRELFMLLARGADVVVENFRPGVLDRLGVGWPELFAVNPRLLLCSLTGYGQSGPDRLRPGHDINYTARSGILAQNGSPAGPPRVVGVPVADIISAWQALAAVLGALLELHQTGRGRHLDVAMAEGALTASLLGLSAAEAGAEPEARGRGVLSGEVPAYSIYRCADGRYLSVGALEPRFFAAFCKALGRPDLAEKGLVRGDEAAAVQMEIAAEIQKRTLSEWTAILPPEACSEPVRELSEIPDLPQHATRGVFAGPLPGEGEFRYLRTPLPLERAELAPAPELGAHGREVLQEIGLSESEIVSLRTSGAVG